MTRSGTSMNVNFSSRRGSMLSTAATSFQFASYTVVKRRYAASHGQTRGKALPFISTRTSADDSKPSLSASRASVWHERVDTLVFGARTGCGHTPSHDANS